MQIYTKKIVVPNFFCYICKKKSEMSNWYEKYLSIYGKPLDEIPQEIIVGIRVRLAMLQSKEPLVSIVIIAYNEERRLLSCLWSLSDFCSKYPLEIIGVDNHSSDHTKDVYESVGVPCFVEQRRSPGFARQCGLKHARGKYYFCIDADTFYPPLYVDLMMGKLQRYSVSCVSSFWSFYPDKEHSAWGLYSYELIRDVFLYVQHFKRPELCVREMVFAFKVDYARQVKIRTDIRRGEDGSLALSLKQYGKIAFLYMRNARPVTGYGTIGRQSLWQSLIDHVKIQGKGIARIFYSTDHYEDSDDNLFNK